jgi:hypothetical protein
MVIQDPEQQQAQDAQRQQAAKVGKLTKDAHFNVIVKVTKSFDSRRTQEATAIGELLAADPQLLTWFGDLYFKNQDGPGHMAMAERAKLMLAPPIQQMLAKQEQGQKFDPAAEAQIAQLTQQLQLAEQAIQELAEDAKGKRLDYQAKVDVEKLQGELKVKLEAIQAERDVALADREQATEFEKIKQDNATKMYIADLQAKTKGVLQAAEAEHEMIALDHTQSHEAEQQNLDRDNQARLAAHEAAVADGQQDRSENEAERGRQASATEAERAREATATENERNRQVQPDGGA